MRQCCSQNHSMVGVGRDLCGSSSPTPLPKQVHLQQAAQDFVPAQGHPLVFKVKENLGCSRSPGRTWVFWPMGSWKDPPLPPTPQGSEFPEQLLRMPDLMISPGSHWNF